jgi:hypothetical protein
MPGIGAGCQIAAKAHRDRACDDFGEARGFTESAG